MDGRKACGICSFFLFLLSAAPVGAVTHSYDAVITATFGPHSTAFTAGDKLVISYTLDPLATDTNSDPQMGLFHNAVLSMTISFPNLGVFAVAGPAGTAQTFDNVVNQPSGQWADGIYIFGGPISSASSLRGELISFMEVDFGTGFLIPPNEPLMFSSDALPLFKLPIVRDESVLFLGTSSGFTQVDFATDPNPPSGPERLLTVGKLGRGTGTVISNPAGINCGTDCSQNFLDGTTVTLTAKSGGSSTFAGWLGACTGRRPCVVIMDAAKSVTARFALAIGPPVPSAPSGLTATAISPQQVLLTWHDNSTNENTFSIEMRRGQQAFREAATISTNGTRVVISSLRPGTRYFFRIRARNTFGFSTYSNQAFVTTPR